MMKDICMYLIKLRGQVSESEINAMSPIQMTLDQAEADGTLLSLCTDQSGLIGLMRHLHGLGFIFLSMTRVDRVEVDDSAAAGSVVHLGNPEKAEQVD